MTESAERAYLCETAPQAGQWTRQGVVAQAYFHQLQQTQTSSASVMNVREICARGQDHNTITLCLAHRHVISGSQDRATISSLPPLWTLQIFLPTQQVKITDIGTLMVVLLVIFCLRQVAP